MGLVTPSVFEYTQATPAVEWTIQHNLSGGGSIGLPVVEVLIDINGVTNKIIPMSVQVIDSNTVKLTFSIARAGKAIVMV